MQCPSMNKKKKGWEGASLDKIDELLEETNPCPFFKIWKYSSDRFEN